MAERPASILMVDDEARNLDLLEALLLPQGYRLLRAGSGDDALAAVTAERPDLILLDVMMPRMDGFEVCRRLKADASTRFVPVVMITSLRDAEDRIRGIEVGADDFLSKPVNRHRLVTRVRASLRLGYYPGTAFPLTVAAQLTRTFGPDGMPETVALVVRDVTEQRREERLKGDFLSLISHKFKTPITVIDGYLGLLLRGQLGELTGQQRETLQGVAQKAEELERLVDRLLTFSALAGADLTRERELMRADVFLPGVTDRVRRRYPDRKFGLTTEIQPALPMVAADPQLLEMVWENLVENAVKFNEKPEPVVRVGIAVEGGGLKCSVADNGPGLPHEKGEDIFRPFNQLEVSFTGNVDGAGLGLPLVRRIVEAHGGLTWVESHIGTGSTFFFTLPLASSDPPAA